ncbi:SGNH/GDSL hydrolase family protein [Tenggerimyces flavus]|uniref:SGNH/GDSL hydrolase family protein n=1 Tax=Tenggerimyces flavus TaxID=1708749 RepID=A0ABV7YDL1_9ACTN|nr:SGNH/GDSL hydrolase family protein [Tenggerimyces flavus]MBM7791311.1 lysophospholipase L1-like esterase [Tenggerimyces flavus]
MGESGRRMLRVGIASVIALACFVALGGTAQAAPAYTALGDSYTSGVGTRVYAYDSSSCKRSNYAYPVLDSQRLGLTLTFAACSGARVPDVLNQLGSLNANTAYVTVMVGGNDAGFAPVITQCAKPAPYSCTSQLDAAQAYVRNTLPGTLDNLYDQIRSRAANAKVVVVGYPRIFMGEDCNAGTFFSASEMTRLNATADLLNSTIAAQASAHGFGMVNPTQAFIGHAVCGNPEWLNGLSNPIGESYHPNTRGQVGYADLVESALR